MRLSLYRVLQVSSLDVPNVFAHALQFTTFCNSNKRRTLYLTKVFFGALKYKTTAKQCQCVARSVERFKDSRSGTATLPRRLDWVGASAAGVTLCSGLGRTVRSVRSK